MQPLNRAAQERQEKPTYTLRDFVTSKYLPFCRRKWKDSTAGTTKQRIEHNLVMDLGDHELESLSREQLQDFLERKTASGLSASVVSHLRWAISSLSRRAGIDPKVVADQLGHGLGANLDVYTKSDLEQRSEAVRKLESEVLAA